MLRLLKDSLLRKETCSKRICSEKRLDSGENAQVVGGEFAQKRDLFEEKMLRSEICRRSNLLGHSMGVRTKPHLPWFLVFAAQNSALGTRTCVPIRCPARKGCSQLVQTRAPYMHTRPCALKFIKYASTRHPQHNDGT